MKKLSHLDSQGRARMVDVGGKSPTPRRAVASAFVVMAPETLDALRSASLEKGDAVAVARLAGIQGAKLTPQLVPLCHPLPLDQVAVDLAVETDGVRITAEARTRAATGVEMEALTGAAVAALALIDMVKGIDRAAHVRDLRVDLKEGGKSGRWTRDEDAEA
jgi:cyclic pyranopterin phosphate synthase